MNKQLISIAVALCCGVTANAFAADGGMSKDAYKTEKGKLETTYKDEKKACDVQKGNAKDVCVAGAKGREKAGKAELEARYKPSPRADEKAKDAKADADYAVAGEKCDDLKGNAKDVCRKDAKATRETAIKAAKVAKTENTRGINSQAAFKERKDASKDEADAQFSAARERCDGMKGDAKETCIADAKRKFNKS